jgi:hypothetical protein
MCCWILLRSLLECLHALLSWLLCNYRCLLLYLSVWHLLCSLWICSVHGMPHRPILWPWIALLQSVLCLTRRAVEVFHVIMCGPVQQLPSLLPASVLRAMTHTCSNVSPDSSINISSISDAYIHTAYAAIYETKRQYPVKRPISGPPSVTLIVVWTACASSSTLRPEPQCDRREAYCSSGTISTEQDCHVTSRAV